MRALLSVSNKAGIVTLARGLVDLGCDVVSTGGTARALREAGVPVIGIEDVTGMPEMMGGRVKTLHPAVHGGILARRDRDEDQQAIAQHGIHPIDVVVVNLYPFAEAAARADTGFDDLIEEIDIGGPTLVRAAAKNFRDVLVLVDPTDYAAALEVLRRDSGPQLAFRFGLARKAFRHTADYDRLIAGTLAGIRASDAGFQRTPAAETPLTPPALTLSLTKLKALRYGENPHQEAAWYGEAGAAGLGAAQVLQGKDLSFTNLLDLDAAARLVLEFDEPVAAVLKHTNPCGVATAASVTEAYVRARATDPLSAFGGIVGVNRPIDAATATAITSTFIEAIIAPSVAAAARPILATKPAMRVLAADLSAVRDGTEGVREVRSVLGGWLVQRRDVVSEASMAWAHGVGDPPLRVVTARAPTEAEWEALRFAWRVCAHAKSNTIVFTRRDRTVAIGAGQMSRVDAVRVAVLKATADLAGTVAASDAFFPFRDGLDAIAEAGATAVVQPGGSKRDDEVVAAANEHGLAMVLTGRRHFWH